MFAPTKTWRRWHHRINTNQKRYAMCSAGCLRPPKRGGDGITGSTPIKKDTPCARPDVCAHQNVEEMASQDQHQSKKIRHVLGRMFAPTKTWRRWHHRINTNQKRYAMYSAIAATGVPALVMSKGHKINTNQK